MSERHYANPYARHPACLSSTKEKASHPPEISPELSVRLRAGLEAILAQCDSAYRRNPSSNTCVYTGTAGIAHLHLHVATTLHAEDDKKRRHHLLQAQSLVKACLSRLPSHGITFLCGAGGPLAVAAVVEAGLGQTERAKSLLEQLKELYTGHKESLAQLPSELLYGHVGYLYCLLFVNAYLPGAIDKSLLEEVVDVALQAGEKGRESGISCPLMYTWHGRHYLGAAHGLSGIVSLLLQLQTESAALPPTVKFLADLQLPSGNFPSSLESCHDDSRHSDRLVHWCHGAPGFIHMLSHAYQCLGDGRYLVAAESCGETVWERGLLKKGYGLCHGAAGNAYTFLQLYQLTGHMYHWHRALKFAEWCLSSDERVTRIPDTPLSLFEGTAGVALFYCDLLTVSSGGKAPFPCLEIPQPKITFSLDAN